MSEGLKARLDAQDTHIREVAKSLTTHVTECAAIQKKVLVVGSVTLGWIVGHSPEGVDLIKTVIKAVAG